MTEPGIISMVGRAEGGPYFTISQVAEKVGRSEDTIRRWQKPEENAHLRPSHKMPLGDENSSAFVWLYTEKDIQRLIAHAKMQKPGRPKGDRQKRI